MKTVRLYDDNSYLKEFDALVLSSEETKDGFLTVLDKTAFFPEEGGQCCDTGSINGTAVKYVFIENGIVYHLTEKALSGNVHGIIDFEKRFRNMQNHSGEHILSGLFYKEYSLNNVGFHLGESDITMDVDGILNEEKVNHIERLANKAVFENRKITAFYPSKKELENIAYRSKKQIDDDVRIVIIDGVDVCACCAPHVSFTGEIGLIKVLDFYKMRNGTRLHIKCGFEALNDYKEKQKNIKEISNLLKAPQEETADAVKSLLNEIKELKYGIGLLKREKIMLKAENIKKANGNLLIFEDGLTPDDLRLFANAVKSKCDAVCAVLSGNDKDGYSYCLASENVNLKEKAKEINFALNGRGGGQPTMIFGSFNAIRKEIEDYFKGNGK